MLSCSSALSYSVITAINYILNKTAENMLSLESAISYIMGIIEGNKDTFEELFSMTDIRSGECMLHLHNNQLNPPPPISCCMHATKRNFL